jgi:hypothetical protein
MIESPILPARTAASTRPDAPAERSAAEWLVGRITLVRARDRIDAELRRVALDVEGRCEHDELDAASKLLLLRVTERAIEATLDPLVASFADALGRGIDGLPADLRDRLTRADARRDIGWD